MLVLKHTEMALSVICMMNGDTPSPMQGSSTEGAIRRLDSRIRR